MNTNGHALIKLEGACKAYGKIFAINGVSLEVQPGEFVAVTGPSGSGKSTLLGILGMLERPTSGAYYLNGRAVADLGDGEASRLRNKHFGFVFQQFYLLPELTAWENVARPLLYAGLGRREQKERSTALLEKLGLEHRVNHRPSELSGGEQQRVAVARALVNEPQIILADEPTGNLPQAQWEPLLALLEELNGAGKTVLIVSHEPEVASRAHRQVLLRDGQNASA